jgi:maleate isomerase
LACDTATSIAHTPPREVIDVVLNELDGDNVDAIVQTGTNLSTLDIFPVLEKQLGKPIIPINVATIWHALRARGVLDKFYGKGWLLERF